MVNSEDVDVVEAIPSTEDLNEHASAQDRDDGDSKPDQLALESDDGPPPKNHGYNSPSRGNLVKHPSRGNSNHMGPAPHHAGKPFGHGKTPLFDHSSYNGPPPPLPSKQVGESCNTAILIHATSVENNIT